jgi:hypothetical protein
MFIKLPQYGFEWIARVRCGRRSNPVLGRCRQYSLFVAIRLDIKPPHLPIVPRYRFLRIGSLSE